VSFEFLEGGFKLNYGSGRAEEFSLATVDSILVKGG
jgi:hypothetical protein